MEPFQLLEKETLYLIEWEKEFPGLLAGFSTKRGGESQEQFRSLNLGLHVKDKTDTVRQNRDILARIIGIPVNNWVAGEQIHNNKVKTVSLEDRGKGARSPENAIKGVDGLIAKEQGILATAFFADCVPLFFMDPVSGWFGIAHAGWKGTVAGIGREMVSSLHNMGGNPADIKVTIGPSIGRDHYEVDQQVISRIPDKWRGKVSIPQPENKHLLDLKKLNQLILQEAGVLKKHISISSYCTYRDESLFFSHRRDQGNTGRMLGFIGKANQS